MNIHKINMKDIHKNIYSGHLKMGGNNPKGEYISFTNYYMELDGKPFFAIMGEFHFSRYDCKYWEEEINKMKLCGVNILSTYVFWNHHEEEEGTFNWEGNNNLRYFLDLCSKQEMKIVLRIGPWCHGEMRNGGFPDWLYGKPFRPRTNDEGYLYYVRRLYGEIGRQIADKMYFEGGPVIGIQLENEYMTAAAPWAMTMEHATEYTRGAEDGASHLAVLKNIADSVGIRVPFYTNTAWVNTPEVEEGVLPLCGAYAYGPWKVIGPEKIHPPTNNYVYRSYHDRNAVHCTYDATKYPFSCCEMMGGMMMAYNYRAFVPPESVEAMSNMKVAGGCNFVGYYMFHGGSNPVGKHSFMNEHDTPKISYDYQAPVREFGQLNHSYKVLKLLHMFYKDFEGTFIETATVLPENALAMHETDTDALRYAARVKGSSGFLFLNNFQDHLDLKAKMDIGIALNLPEETITLPREKGFNLKNRVSCILPFNLNMEGTLLKYATAQLITKIKDGDTIYYFFFTPEGFETEYCFERAALTSIIADNCRMDEEDNNIFVYVPEGEQSTLTLHTNDSQKVKICTLTRKDALNLWKINIWGQERLIISESGVLTGDGFIKFYSIGDPEIKFSVFPEIREGLKIPTASIEGIRTGLFTDYVIKKATKKIDLQIDRICNTKAVVNFPKDLFEGIEDVFLRINYRGDIGYAFIDNMMVNDNFCNGTVWEIGLKKFNPLVLQKGMHFHIIPLKYGENVVMDDTMALHTEFVGEEISEIDSIEAVPEYRVMVMKG